jgi:hypothetical protein
MSESILSKVEAVTAPPKPEGDFVYVTIPERDVLDWPYPTVQLNRMKFEPGKTYKCPAEVGREVQERMDMYNKATVRLLQPKSDRKALADVNRGSMWQTAAFGGEPVLASGEKIIDVKW